MRRVGRWALLYICVTILAVTLLPWLCNRGQQLAPQGSALPSAEPGSIEPTVRVWLHEEERVVEYPLEEAVLRVVAAEMPVSFPEEALAAQAIVARTYIMRRLPAPWGQVERHQEEQADICDDYHHCQAFQAEESLKAHWGDSYDVYYAKVAAAVAATRGQVLLWEGELVDPVYHSTCGGKTESAAGCWQHDVPVLQSVTCLWDSDAPRYLATDRFSEAEIMEKLGVSKEELAQFQIVSRTDGGRVAEATAGSKSWSGTEIRSLLGLNSANFSYIVTDDEWLFTVQGFGHGVGLCQYGAKGMAEAGYTAADIVAYYYQGATITVKY